MRLFVQVTILYPPPSPLVEFIKGCSSRNFIKSLSLTWHQNQKQADLDDSCFQPVQLAEILHLLSKISIKKQLVKSGETQNLLMAVKLHLN